MTVGYPRRVPPLFSRRNATAGPDTTDEPVDVPSVTDESDESDQSVIGQPRGYTPAKGRPTPKRSEARARKPATPVPANRREAARQMRERQRAERVEARAGMQRGDEKYMIARDRGPERALVRDLVDTRRSVGTWFFVAAFAILVGTNRAMPPVVQFTAQAFWLFVLVLFVVDSVVLSRKIKKVVWQRYPKTTQRKGGLYMYGIMRSMTFRKLRMPKPRVRPGDTY